MGWGIGPGGFEVEGPVDIGWRRDIYLLGDENVHRKKLTEEN